MRKVITFVMFAWTSGCAVGHHAVQPVRVLVLNMHAGKDAAGASNLDQVAALINSSGASLALLQEVDKGTRRSGGVDQPARLQERPVSRLPSAPA